MSIKYIILSSLDCEHSSRNKAYICNTLKGRPLSISSEDSRIALLDITFPLQDDPRDPQKNVNVLIFPVDQSKNETMIIPPGSTLEDLNAMLMNMMSRKFPSQFKAPALKFSVYDGSGEEDSSGMLLKQGSEFGSENYQAPWLCFDPFQGLIYQIPGYYNGNLPVFLQLSESLLDRFRYGGMIFAPEENRERFRHFSRWKFCRREIGTEFPTQLVSKPLIKVEPSRNAFAASTMIPTPPIFKIPKITKEELISATFVRKTKNIVITCNLIDAPDKVMETLVVTPEANVNGYFHRFNHRFTSPKFHRISETQGIKDINLCIKDRSTNSLLSLPVGETIATIVITNCMVAQQ